MKRILIFIVLATGAIASPSVSAVTEEEVAETLVRQMVDFTRIVIAESDPDNPGVVYAAAPDDHNQAPCYPLAWLYKTGHPLNPYFGDTAIRDRAVAICDHVAGVKSLLEWPLYALCQVYELLEDELGQERKKQWKDYAAYYAGTRGIRPFSYTSPNHEAWSALALLRAGQVFGEPAWESLGRGLMRQLIRMQTDIGYYDEGSHHGPSMKYNQLQLAAMLLFADHAEDRQVEAACKKLSDFMLRYSFPDGSTSGALDGRQSWYVGFFGTLCYGWDRWPAHKTLARRIFETRKNLNMLDPGDERYSLSDWYAYFGYWFVLDELLSLKPDAPAAPLPQDRNGYLATDSGPTFEGGAARNHDWMVIVSAVNSHVPLISQSIFRLDRQSRIDIWRPETGLIVGGGHNLRTAEVPLANTVLLTGWNGVDCEHGVFSGVQAAQDRLATYVPRDIEADITLERQRLRSSYGHGDITLEVRPVDETRLKVGFEYDVFSARKLLVQLPLIVYFDSEALVDGAPFAGNEPMSVTCEVTLLNPRSGATVRVTPPAGLKAKIHPPVEPVRWYIENEAPNRYKPFYGISLLSVQIDEPGTSGRGEFLIDVVPRQ